MYHAINNSSRAPSPIASMTRSISSHSSKSHHFRLATLPSTRMAHLTGSRKLISRLGQSTSLEPSDTDIESTPVCYLLDEPEPLENLKITDTEDMKNHIVVCVHHEITNIFKFVYNLR
jgi:hypothetical protein